MRKHSRVLFSGGSDDVGRGSKQADDSKPWEMFSKVNMDSVRFRLLLLVVISTRVPCAHPADSCVIRQADLSFLLDSSGSVGNTGITNSLDFIDSFVSTVNVSPHKVRIAVVTADNFDNPRYGFYLNDSRSNAELTNNLRKLRNLYNSSPAHAQSVDLAITHTAYGVSNTLKFMADEIHGDGRPGIPKIIVLLTDGQIGARPTDRDVLDSKGIYTFVLGVMHVNNQTLLSLASDPQELLYLPKVTRDSFQLIQTRFKEKVCNFTDAILKTREVDLTFVVDTSGSAGSKSGDVKRIVNESVSNINVTGINLTLSLLTFAGEVTPVVWKSKDKSDVTSKLLTLRFEGRSDIGKALSYLRQNPPSQEHSRFLNEEMVGPRWVIVVASDGTWLGKRDIMAQRDFLVATYGARVIFVCTGGTVPRSIYKGFSSRPEYDFAYSKTKSHERTALLQDVGRAIEDRPKTKPSETIDLSQCESEAHILGLFQLRKPPASLKQELIAVLQSLSPDVTTATLSSSSSHSQLAEVSSSFASRNHSRSSAVMVIFLNTMPSESQRFLVQAMRAQRMGLHMVMVGLSDDVSIPMLLRSASLATQFLALSRPSQLQDRMVDLRRAVCDRCSKSNDVVIVVDLGRLSEDDLRKVTAILEEVLDATHVGPRSNQVAFVTNTEVRGQWTFTAHPDKLSLYAYVHTELRAKPRLPMNLTSVMAEICDVVISPVNGARGDAETHVIVFSSGGVARSLSLAPEAYDSRISSVTALDLGASPSVQTSGEAHATLLSKEDEVYAVTERLTRLLCGN